VANLEKHKKNLVLEWLDAEESTVPAQPRSTHILGSYIKIQKPITKKSRPPVVEQAQTKIDPANFREPGIPPNVELKSTPAASWEHQKKLERLPNLRAPYKYKGTRAAH
jgi:hypothetical protein